MDCVFESNANTDGYTAGVVNIYAGACDLEFCTFLTNAASYASALSGSGSEGGNELTLGVTDCTFADNAASGDQRAAVRVRGSTSLTMETTVVAFNRTSKAVSALYGATVDCSACCIYGNEEGDWVDCLAGLESLHDNMELDPRLCGLATGDFRLCANSPCLPENNVPGVQIGAHGWGCADCESPVEEISWGRVKSLFR
jgi:hypothetical protein